MFLLHVWNASPPVFFAAASPVCAASCPIKRRAIFARRYSIAFGAKPTRFLPSSEPGLRGELPASCAEPMLLVVIPSRFGARPTVFFPASPACVASCLHHAQNQCCWSSFHRGLERSDTIEA